MPDGFQGQRHPVKHPAGFHHGHVERLAVVRDQQGRGAETVGHLAQQRALAGVAGEHELADLERAHVEPAAADEKRDGPGAAAQARRLEVDKQRAGSRTIVVLARRLTGGARRQRGIEQPQRIAVLELAVPDAPRAVNTIGLIAPIDDEGAAEAVGDDAPAEHVRDTLDLDGAFVAPRVRLVRQLARSRVRRPAPSPVEGTDDRAEAGC